MKINKILFFSFIYNLLFVGILNAQHLIRFGIQKDFTSQLMYSIIFSVSYFFIPLLCFISTWFIINKLFIQNDNKKTTKGFILLLLFTTASIYIVTKMIVSDPIFLLITVSTAFLSVCLFFFMYREEGIFTD